MADLALKRRLSTCEFFVAPGVFDTMTVLIASEVGFDAVHTSGH